MRIKFVTNQCYGGFSLSAKAVLRMRELGSEIAKTITIKGEKTPWGDVYDYDSCYCGSIDRMDPHLVQAVEELGKEAGGTCAKLEVWEADVWIELGDYDGYEHPGVGGSII